MGGNYSTILNFEVRKILTFKDINTFIQQEWNKLIKNECKDLYHFTLFTVFLIK